MKNIRIETGYNRNNLQSFNDCLFPDDQIADFHKVLNDNL